MKWLFFILLLSNMGVFLWNYPHIFKAGPKVHETTGRESLLLLSEVESVEDNQSFTTASERFLSENEPAEDSESSVEERVKWDGNLAEQEDPEEKITASDETLNISDAENADESVVLTSSEPILTPESVDFNIATEPSVMHCGRMGPIDKRSQAEELSSKMTGYGLQPEISTETVNKQDGYWVLVPPQKDRATAVKIVKRLRQEGITDLWRFTNGSLAHAISLGLFLNERRAEIRRKEIAVKGFDVEVRPRYRQTSTYWLDYNYSGDSPLTDENWNTLADRYPDMENHSVDCQEIASQ